MKNSKHVLLIGGPGAGKGTQAALLVAQGYHHLSTGDLLREAQKDLSEEGQRIKALLATGALFPDKEMFALVSKELEKLFNQNPQKKILFDGFPRTLPQAAFLDDTLRNINQSLGIVLHIEVSPQTMFERMRERGKISGRQDDQNPETILHRIEVYQGLTSPLLSYYNSRVITINGEQSIGDVGKSILINLEAQEKELV